MKERMPKKAPLDVKYILKTYWGFLRKEKPLFTGVVFSALVLSVFGFASRYLFKIIVDNGEIFTNGKLTTNEFIQLLIIIGIIWSLVLVLSAITRWIRLHLINKLEVRIMFNLKNYYYTHIVNLSHKFHTTHKTGSLISRISRGSSAMERMTDFIGFQTLTLVFELVVSGIALMTVDKSICAVVLVIGIIFVINNIRLQKLQRKYTLFVNSAEDLEKAMIGDTFTNIDSIKYYGKENLIIKRYGFLSSKVRQATLKQWNVSRWIVSSESLIMGIGGLAVLYITVKSFIEGKTTLGTLTFVWALYWAILESVRQFMEGLRGYNRSIADFHDLFQYGKAHNEIKDKLNAKDIEIKQGVIEFKNVSFKYHQNELFNNFNLKVDKNQKVALVGHSGSGKSTLVKILYRLYDLDNGTIKIDGVDIKDVKQESLRSELSIVPQECVLFDDTIYNNILFSNPKASRKEVLQAIKFAQLDKTIKEFPYREDTIVGERGVKLSGGEKQRVSIARAILANKKILVLDEATSSLDSETEFEIQKDLEKLMQNRTAIIIAHRLSTIMKADLIVVLKNGKIVQTGKHSELIKQQGEYKRLWNLQRGGYIK